MPGPSPACTAAVAGLHDLIKGSHEHVKSFQEHVKSVGGAVKDDTALLFAKLSEWVAIDMNHSTIAELKQMLNDMPRTAEGLEAKFADLKKKFLNRLEFGTAGLRGPMGAGFNCMNDVTVLQTAQGLAKYYVNKFGAEQCKQRGVVLGFDGRHNSERFAHVSAAVFLVSGFKVYLNSKVTATPMNPFCLVKKNCLCGIQVTASHNPKADNGYKVYADNGAQIIPPMDSEVADLILKNLNRLPGVSDMLDTSTGLLIDSVAAKFRNDKMLSDPYDEIFSTYIKEMTAELSIDKGAVEKSVSSLKSIVYTPMHGVGFPFVEKILTEFGFAGPRLLTVEEQKYPDPEFTTVAFPNPEEKGAMDMAIALAEKNGSPMVIANDPDADRFACVEKNDGKWHIFSGDELGIIFAHRSYELKLKQNVPKEKMLFICSAVSSRMMQKMCSVEGCKFEETMTGFKWMMNRAIEGRDKDGLIPIFVYEEALGYAVSMSVPDKDGVSAAGVWVELASELYSKGKNITGYLQDLRNKYGYFVCNNSYFLCYDKKAIADLFAEFRDGDKYKWMIGDYKVSRIRDVTTGYDSSMPDKKCTFPLSPSSQMITLFFENGAVLTLRTSGTEPKLKWYSEISASSPQAATAELQKVVDACISTIMQPSKYPLEKPKTG